uniref:Carboxylesterase type B domain-containing protein n=1 Tax=Timema shepardi TaxID=629360 RepID=A0A7R9AM08_TIMSH|nr:unnamed protein product [Timema shepardi]
MSRAAHGDELFYLFRSDFIQNNIEPCSPQESVSLNMVQLWTNFAKTGDPSRDLDVKWSPYTKLDNFFMNIDTKLSLQKDLNKDRMEFWEHLYKEVSK